MEYLKKIILIPLFCSCVLAVEAQEEDSSEERRSLIAFNVEYGTRWAYSAASNVYLFLLDNQESKLGAFLEAGVIISDIPELWHYTFGGNISYGQKHRFYIGPMYHVLYFTHNNVALNTGYLFSGSKGLL
ncbi:MAG: hypothetical protein ACI9DM_001473, partial [Cyclobacteriaceae bacterium]